MSMQQSKWILRFSAIVEVNKVPWLPLTDRRRGILISVMIDDRGKGINFHKEEDHLDEHPT